MTQSVFLTDFLFASICLLQYFYEEAILPNAHHKQYHVNKHESCAMKRELNASAKTIDSDRPAKSAQGDLIETFCFRLIFRLVEGQDCLKDFSQFLDEIDFFMNT